MFAISQSLFKTTNRFKVKLVSFVVNSESDTSICLHADAQRLDSGAPGAEKGENERNTAVQWITWLYFSMSCLHNQGAPVAGGRPACMGVQTQQRIAARYGSAFCQL